MSECEKSLVIIEASSLMIIQNLLHSLHHDKLLTLSLSVFLGRQPRPVLAQKAVLKGVGAAGGVSVRLGRVD